MSVMSDKNVPGAFFDEPMEDMPPPEIKPMEDIYMDDTDMFEVAENIEIPALMVPLPEPLSSRPMEEEPHHHQPRIHNHGPSNYCSFCWCDACRRFYGTGKPTQIVSPRTLEIPPRPRYSYLAFLNTMRAASARREEERQNKRLAEREQAAGEKSPKKSEATKTPNQNLSQILKRRRV